MKTSKDGLGDRIKQNYENRARHYLTRRTPVIIRVDGKAFHTFTRGMERPFDSKLIGVMRLAALQTAREMQGCMAFFVASDEVSFLLTDWAKLNSCAWFDYNQSKIESVSAATMTAYFNRQNGLLETEAVAVFDSRSFNLPKSEVVNYFLWRMKDWVRNSVTMLASSHFSHKTLQGVSTKERIALMEEKGVHWSALMSHLKHGSFYVRHPQDGEDFFEVTLNEAPTYENIAAKLKFLDRNADTIA